MKKILIITTIALLGIVVSSFTAQNQNVGKSSANGEVIKMNKKMFLDEVFDYEKSEEWKFKGDKPVIIDLYADWCGPCRKIAPIMQELAKEYEGKIVIYKVDVDKEKELAAVFNATSIPLLVFIPTDKDPQLFRGAADKETYKKAIDEFLLNQKNAN